MKIIGIKTNDGYYLSDDLRNNTYYSSYSSPLLTYFINGSKPEPTFHKSWVKVKGYPTKIETLKSLPAINKRYELKDKSLSDKFALIWEYDKATWYDDNYDERVYADGFIKELYEYKEDKQEPVLESVDFEFEIISEIDEVNQPKPFSYLQKSVNASPESLQYDMVTKIITPSLLLHTQPCKLSAQESYNIIRKYIKENIDGKVAQITSDYDFCLTVKKNVMLAKEHTYQVDVNRTWGGRKRKPKYETRIQKTDSLEIFRLAPKPYQTYPVVTPFEGDSQDNLNSNIESYLTHIIGVINEPLKYCSCCNGTGVLLHKV